MSAAEIEKAEPQELQEALTAHEAWANRLMAADDPGRGLPPAQAEAARKTQLHQLQEHTEELGRLRAVWEATSPENQREAALWERLRSAGRRQAAREATSPEEQARLDQAHEALRAQARDRKARERLAALKERLRNPPNAHAPELVGAILMRPELFEALEHKLRPDGTGGFTATHLLDPTEIGVLFTVLHLLRETGSVEIAGMATNGRWPRREPPLVPVDGLRAALLELRNQRWLSFTVAGDVARVTYGERILELAADWGIELPAGS